MDTLYVNPNPLTNQNNFSQLCVNVKINRPNNFALFNERQTECIICVKVKVRGFSLNRENKKITYSSVSSGTPTSSPSTTFSCRTVSHRCSRLISLWKQPGRNQLLPHVIFCLSFLFLTIYESQIIIEVVRMIVNSRGM